MIHLFEYLPDNDENTDEETRLDPPVCPYVGTVQSMIIFVKFNGDIEFPETVSYYDERLNSQISSVNSLKNYLSSIARNKLDYQSNLYGIENNSINSNTLDN